MLLRPKTGLKDMVAELNPGTRPPGKLPEGGAIPVSQTLPDVNLDEILAVARRRHARLPAAAARRRRRRRSRATAATLAQTIRRFEPTARAARAGQRGAGQRRRNIRRVDPQLLAGHRRARAQGRPGRRRSSRAPTRSSRASPSQDAEHPGDAAQLPGALQRDADARWPRRTRWPTQLGPTLEELRPGARALGPTLRETRPFLRKTTPIIRDEIRPFARASLPDRHGAAPGDARPRRGHAGPDDAPSRCSTRCSTSSPTTRPGSARRATCSGSRGPTTPAPRCSRTQDAHGPIRHGLVVLSAARPSQLLERVAAANPQLGTLVDLLNGPTAAQVCPSVAGGRGAAAMNKSAPSFGRIAAMVGVRAVVLRPAAVPVAGLRRPDPAQAEGLPLPGLVRRGDAARQGGRRADLRRAGRQGQDDRARQADRPLDRDDRDGAAVRAAAVATRGRSCARRRCWARPTSSSRRARRRRKPIPEGGTLAAVAGRRRTVELDEILRAFDPKTRARVPGPGCRRRRRASTATGATSTTRSATSARSPRTPATLVDILNRQQGAVSGWSRNTGVVFGALTERDGQLRSLIENSNTVFATTTARDQQLKEAFVALPTFERESRADARRGWRTFARRHQPAGHPAAPGGARAEPDAGGPRRARAGPQDALPASSAR